MPAISLLKIHDRGSEVQMLQRLLNSLVVPPPRLKEDGDFGAKTDAALKRFQQQSGLVPDGIVGPKTWTALGIKQHASKPAPNAEVPQPQEKRDWMQIAEGELDVHENSLPGQHNKRIVEYHQTTTLAASTDEVPWCSSFVNWAMTKSGNKGTNSAAAASWLGWGEGLTAPQKGAVTVIRQKKAGKDSATGSATGNHVAFYVSSTATHVRLLGGNQSDSVKYSNFSLSAYEVKGYRWPS